VHSVISVVDCFAVAPTKRKFSPQRAQRTQRKKFKFRGRWNLRTMRLNDLWLLRQREIYHRDIHHREHREHRERFLFLGPGRERWAECCVVAVVMVAAKRARFFLCDLCDLCGRFFCSGSDEVNVHHREHREHRERFLFICPARKRWAECCVVAFMMAATEGARLFCSVTSVSSVVKSFLCGFISKA
jgi:hypothetical protein